MRHNIFLTLKAGLASCALVGGVAFAQPDNEPLAGSDLPLFSGVDPSPAAAPVPELELTGELLFQILAADIAAQRGAWAAATNTGLQIARSTRDYRLARRALEYALAGNDLPRAWEAAQLWAELSPQDPQARQTELMLAAANGHTENLAKALRQQIDGAKDKGTAIIHAQQILSRLADKPRALALLDEVLAGDLRKLPEARLALAQSSFEAGDHERALREARAALAARPDWDIAAGMVLQFGVNLEPEETLTSTRAFIKRHPEARDLRLALVSALVQRGDYDGAMAELQAMSKYAPEDFELIYLQGAISYEAGRLREAEKYLNTYIQIESGRRQASADAYDPTSALADAQLMLARIAEEEGRYDDAFRLLQQVTAPEAEYLARLRQAVVRGKQNRIDEAMRLLDESNPEDEREQVMQALTRAQILREAGRVAQAAAALEAAVAVLPDSTELRYDLALLYERLGRLGDMEQQLRRIIALDPGHAHAYNALGYTLADRNVRLDEAHQLIERALQLRPNDAAILDSMGWVLYRRGENERALEYLQRAWRLQPEAEIGVHLGEVFWSVGRHDEALQIWRTIRAEEPDNSLLQQTLRRLHIDLTDR